MTKTTQLAYCAGIIDGEGCIRVKRTEWERYRGDRKTPGYHASIQVKMVNRDAMDFLAEVLSGTVRVEKRGQSNRRPLYQWSLADLKAETALHMLLPFLRMKKPQAQLLIRLRDLQRDGWSHRTKVIGTRQFPNAKGTMRVIPTKCFSDEYIASLHALFEECKRLNAVGDATI